MTKTEISNRISEIEMIIQREMAKGHRPSIDDQFQSIRVERDMLKMISSKDYRPEPYK